MSTTLFFMDYLRFYAKDEVLGVFLFDTVNSLSANIGIESDPKFFGGSFEESKNKMYRRIRNTVGEAYAVDMRNRLQLLGDFGKG